MTNCLNFIWCRKCISEYLPNEIANFDKTTEMVRLDKTIPIKLFPDETSKCWSHGTPSNCLLGDGARVEINVFHWLVDVRQLPPVLGLVFLRHSWPRAQPLHSTPLAKLVVRGQPVFTAPLDVNSQQIFTEVFVLAGKQKSNEALLCFLRRLGRSGQN